MCAFAFTPTPAAPERPAPHVAVPRRQARAAPADRRVFRLVAERLPDRVGTVTGAAGPGSADSFHRS